MAPDSFVSAFPSARSVHSSCIYHTSCHVSHALRAIFARLCQRMTQTERRLRRWWGCVASGCYGRRRGAKKEKRSLAVLQVVPLLWCCCLAVVRVVPLLLGLSRCCPAVVPLWCCCCCYPAVLPLWSRLSRCCSRCCLAVASYSRS